MTGPATVIVCTAAAVVMCHIVVSPMAIEGRVAHVMGRCVEGRVVLEGRGCIVFLMRSLVNIQVLMVLIDVARI